jgi:hypothetical protein
MTEQSALPRQELLKLADDIQCKPETSAEDKTLAKRAVQAVEATCDKADHSQCEHADTLHDTFADYIEGRWTPSVEAYIKEMTDRKSRFRSLVEGG